MDKPNEFLEVITHDSSLLISGLTGLCVGYESDEWRYNQFSDHLFEWLPEFALNHTEAEMLNKANAVAKLRSAAKNVYKTKKFENRGEFGELILHAIIRQIFDSVPAVSKIFYKDGSNETVKGFDAVHVVTTSKDLELWLGEVKFYDDINNAVSHVITELEKHSENDYLRGEFAAIINKIDKNWQHSDKLLKLLEPNTSLDVIFDAVCIPVLLTYDSPVVSKHKKSTATYKLEIEKEIKKYHEKFCKKLCPLKVKVHLFLLPLKEKAKLVKCLDNKLNAWKQI